MTTTFDEAVRRSEETQRDMQHKRALFLASVREHQLALDEIQRLAFTDENRSEIKAMTHFEEIEALRQAMILEDPDAWGLAVGPAKTQRAMRWRRPAIVALRSMGHSLQSVGRALGGRNHATILYAERQKSDEDEVLAKRLVEQAHRILKGEGPHRTDDS